MYAKDVFSLEPLDVFFFVAKNVGVVKSDNCCMDVFSGDGDFCSKTVPIVESARSYCR